MNAADILFHLGPLRLFYDVLRYIYTIVSDYNCHFRYTLNIRFTRETRGGVSIREHQGCRAEGKSFYGHCLAHYQRLRHR